MLSYLHLELLRLVRARPLASVAVGRGRYSVSYSARVLQRQIAWQAQPERATAQPQRPAGGPRQSDLLQAPYARPPGCWIIMKRKNELVTGHQVYMIRKITL
jgi:hypothetical protein